MCLDFLWAISDASPSYGLRLIPGSHRAPQHSWSGRAIFPSHRAAVICNSRVKSSLEEVNWRVGKHDANLTIDPPRIPDYPKSMKVSAQYAEEHFTDILNAADNGEEIEIARPDKPALFLAPRAISRPSTPSGRPRRELLGAWEGLVTAPTEAEWRTIKKEFADQMPDFSRLTDETA